jgi:hypothetical protein
MFTVDFIGFEIGGRFQKKLVIRPQDFEGDSFKNYRFSRSISNVFQKWCRSPMMLPTSSGVPIKHIDLNLGTRVLARIIFKHPKNNVATTMTCRLGRYF